MDYLKEIESLVEIFRDLGLIVYNYGPLMTAHNTYFLIIFTPDYTERLKLEYDDPETLLENLIRYTSGVKYYKYNNFEFEPEVVFELPEFSSAKELRMKMELKGK